MSVGASCGWPPARTPTRSSATSPSAGGRPSRKPGRHDRAPDRHIRGPQRRAGRPAAARRLVDAVMPIIVGVADPVSRETYLQHLRRGVRASRSASSTRRSRTHRRAAGTAVSDHGGARLSLDAVVPPRTCRSPEQSCAPSAPPRPSCCGCCCSCRTSSSGSSTSSGPTCCRARSRASCIARSCFMRAPDDRGDPRPWDRDRLLARLDEETRALALAVYARSGPDPRDLRLPESNTKWRTCCSTWRPTESKSATSTTSPSRPTPSVVMTRPDGAAAQPATPDQRRTAVARSPARAGPPLSSRSRPAPEAHAHRRPPAARSPPPPEVPRHGRSPRSAARRSGPDASPARQGRSRGGQARVGLRPARAAAVVVERGRRRRRRRRRGPRPRRPIAARRRRSR